MRAAIDRMLHCEGGEDITAPGAGFVPCPVPCPAVT